MIRAEILAIGTELLLGDIVNTNAAFVAKELAALGIPVYWHSVVGDNARRLEDTLATAFDRANVVIAMGGLGPTQDDITKEVAAAFFGMGLALHPQSWEAIQQRFAGRALPENARRNAMVPCRVEGAGPAPDDFCTVLPNHHGSAPGCWLTDGTRTLLLLPGPPHELRPMFMQYAVPLLRQLSGAQGVFVSRTLRIVGVGESRVEDMLRDLIEAQTNPTIAPYAQPTECHLRITAAAPSAEEARALMAPVAREVYARLGTAVYGEGDTPLAGAVLDALRAPGHTLSLAESCTGGLLAAALVAVPGCSDVFRAGYVTYSNAAKTADLAVPEALLAAHGAVSAEVAAAMAQGAAQAAGATVGLSTTGVAGPDGGTAAKPVGTVFVGLYIAGRGPQTWALHLPGNREEIRTRTVTSALDFLRRALLDKEGTP